MLLVAQVLLVFGDAKFCRQLQEIKADIAGFLELNTDCALDSIYRKILYAKKARRRPALVAFRYPVTLVRIRKAKKHGQF